MSDGPQIVHASTIAVALPGGNRRGVLIVGRSGAGKSSLALRLMALGAGLVADDRTHLRPGPDGALWAECPAAIAGRIEARGVGILRAAPTGPVALHLAVDLDHTETERLPPPRRLTFLGRPLACLQKVDNPSFPAAILQYVLHGREGDA